MTHHWISLSGYEMTARDPYEEKSQRHWQRSYTRRALLFIQSNVARLGRVTILTGKLLLKVLGIAGFIAAAAIARTRNDRNVSSSLMAVVGLAAFTITQAYV